MKKLVTLMLAAGMLWSLSAPATASAVDVKLSGTMDFTFERRNVALDKIDNYGTNGFSALQRLRLGMEFIASENLSAYYMLQIGTGMWGSAAIDSKYGQDFSGGHQSRPGQSRISTRFMYLDWIVPSTDIKVRMGKQDLSLPGFAFLVNPVQNGPVAGAQVNVPVNDMLGVNAYWARPSANEAGVYDSDNRFRNLDMFGLALPMKFEGFDFAPYVQVASVGNQAIINNGDWYSMNLGSNRPYANGLMLDRGTSFAWWAGFASRLTMFDPFTVAFDFVYGALDASGYNAADPTRKSIALHRKDGSGTDYTSPSRITDRAGWMAALRMDYKTQWGVPTFLAWYASGDGKGNGASKRMPFTTDDHASSIGVASTFFDYGWGLGGGIMAADITGTWGLSLAWNEFSFMEDLSHDFSVTYFQGTNNKANVYYGSNPANPYASDYFYVGTSPADGYLTTRDSAIDLNLSSTYTIYSNLVANLELGYMFQNFDGKIRGKYNNTNELIEKPNYQNIWRMAVNFRYTF